MHKIRAKDVLDAYWDKKLPVNLVDIISKMDINLVADSSMPKDISGKVKVLPDGYKISYNDNLNAQWLRFVVAHEIGHIALFHLTDGQPMLSDNKGYIEDNDNPIEAEANKFAMELLMPSEVINWLFNTGKVKSFDWLCEVFDVTKTAMKYRLQDLGYLK